ncbi:MAG: PhzF family phenazine biosynthesis protein [Verrucomicrobiales bacterium]|nr:PhzF family phenazine biosynthesis protein [Verrucomicrobiales bacterium]
MEHRIYQIDAFTDKRFGGNPAAVIPLEEWLPDEVLQNIALENNLSETAYFTEQNGCFDLRWFTPATEVDLCGHATLATAHLLWTELGYAKSEIKFGSKSGPLGVKKEGEFYTMDFPTDQITEVDTLESIAEALEAKVLQTFRGKEDYLVLLESQAAVEQLKPDFKKIASLHSRGIIATAEGTDADFVSRCFFPLYGIDEDPVTGSAHTTLAPFWAGRLGKNELTARQLSKREGFLKIAYKGQRTLISGQAVTYMKGTIFVE